MKPFFGRSAPRRAAALALVLAGLWACAGGDDAPVPQDAPAEEAGVEDVRAGEARAEGASARNAPADAFWTALEALCGQAFRGTVVESQPPDEALAGRTLIMHVRTCGVDTIRVPFHVGEDRSRTWVVSRTGSGLRLKHDHRHEDGTEDAVTWYGGDTRTPGTPTRQEFPADTHTRSLLPAAATNVWTLELRPGRSFAYALRREGTERRFRAEFDLTTPVAAPPPPWGS